MRSGTGWFSPQTFLLKPLIRHDQVLTRQRVEDRLPRAGLGPEHVARCRVLLDWEALLAELPQGGVGADQVSIHRGLSLEAVTRSEDASLDWVYFDSSPACGVPVAGLLACAPKFKPGGIKAGHDYSKGPWVEGFRCGVIEAEHGFCVEHDWELRDLTVQRLERPSFAISRLSRA